MIQFLILSLQFGEQFLIFFTSAQIPEAKVSLEPQVWIRSEIRTMETLELERQKSPWSFTHLIKQVTLEE